MLYCVCDSNDSHVAIDSMFTASEQKIGSNTLLVLASAKKGMFLGSTINGSFEPYRVLAKMSNQCNVPSNMKTVLH